MMKKIRNVVCMVLMVWVIASFIDVNLHNDITKENCGQVSSWNLFNLFFED